MSCARSPRWLLALLLPLLSLPAYAEESAEPSLQPIPAEDSAARTPVASLDELLERVRAGSARSRTEDEARGRQLESGKAELQSALETTLAEIVALRERASALEAEWERNDRQIAEGQSALAERLGVLSGVFAELSAVGPGLREEMQDSLLAVQFGPERERALEALLQTAASGERLPAIGDFDSLWFELQRELVETGRVRRFEADVAAPDGQVARTQVVRVGTFNLVTSDGRYLLLDTASGQLRSLLRQPEAQAEANAAALSGSEARAPFGIDPGGARDATVLMALASAPTPGERFARLELPAWLALILGALAVGYGLWRLRALYREHGEHVLSGCMQRLRDVAGMHPGLDAVALEVLVNAALLVELPRLSRGLTALRVAGILAPLLGSLGTVLAITAGVPGDAQVGADAADLAQTLLSTVLGLLAGIPVLALQGWLSVRAERLSQTLEAFAATLVSARAARKVP